MNSYNLVQELLKKKYESITDNEEIKRCDFIKNAFSDKRNIFNLKQQVVKGMLLYLGVKEEELNDIYLDLVSFDNYKETFSSERIIKY